jgi:hypothetical protein
MARRCPPGVLCIENVTIMFICIIFLILGGAIYMYNRRPTQCGCGNKNCRCGYMQGGYMQGGQRTGDAVNNTIMFTPPQARGTGDDVFYDLYKAPLRDDRCFTASGGVPINVSTQSCADAKYRQLGILTRYGGKDETILPLMGRPLFSKRDKWNFYTLNDKNNMIKLPVKVRGKSGTSEYGVDNVYSGDIVFVEGYNDAFKVTTYDNDVVRYLPSL